jgi:hypothetical protein
MDGTRVSIYIVTYRNPIDLNRNIASLLVSVVEAGIYVINNHRSFSLEPEHERGSGGHLLQLLARGGEEVGSWDERFRNLAYHEAECSLSSLSYNREGCSVNEFVHGRQHHPVEGNELQSQSTRSEANEQRADSR